MSKSKYNPAVEALRRKRKRGETLTFNELEVLCSECTERAGMVNAYLCQCGCVVFCELVHAGCTPMFLTCKNESCTSELGMVSQRYHPAIKKALGFVTVLWVRPRNVEELASLTGEKDAIQEFVNADNEGALYDTSSFEHWQSGGLFMKPSGREISQDVAKAAWKEVVTGWNASRTRVNEFIKMLDGRN